MFWVDTVIVKARRRGISSTTRKIKLLHYNDSGIIVGEFLPDKTCLYTVTREVIRSDWIPERLNIYSGAKQTIINLENKNASRAWSVIENKLKNKVYQDERRREKEEPEQISSDFVYVKGEKVRHSSAGEIVQNYHDHWNAVLILPESWLDKKLQEVYYHRRENNKEA